MQLLVKTENLRHKVGYSERNPDTVVEPKLSLQWFVAMKELIGPAMKNVLNDNIQFYPSKFKNTYKTLVRKHQRLANLQAIVVGTANSSILL